MLIIVPKPAHYGAIHTARDKYTLLSSLPSPNKGVVLDFVSCFGKNGPMLPHLVQLRRRFSLCWAVPKMNALGTLAGFMHSFQPHRTGERKGPFVKGPVNNPLLIGQTTLCRALRGAGDAQFH